MAEAWFIIEFTEDLVLALFFNKRLGGIIMTLPVDVRASEGIAVSVGLLEASITLTKEGA